LGSLPEGKEKEYMKELARLSQINLITKLVSMFDRGFDELVESSRGFDNENFNLFGFMPEDIIKIIKNTAMDELGSEIVQMGIQNLNYMSGFTYRDPKSQNSIKNDFAGRFFKGVQLDQVKYREIITKMEKTIAGDILKIDKTVIEAHGFKEFIRKLSSGKIEDAS